MSYTSIVSVIPRGKAAFVALAALFGLAAPALADPAPQTGGVCLQATELDHTQVLNDHQILFYMRGNKVWLNTLRAPCMSLRAWDHGFVMVGDFFEFCSNAQAIRVNGSGQFCHLGPFTPYEKPVGHS
jgi:hypothetical protein